MCCLRLLIWVVCQTTLCAERHRWWACQPLLFMLLLWDVTSAPHNHRDLSMCLFAVWMFGKIDLDQKIKGSLFHRVIFAFCVDLLITQTAVWKSILLSELIAQKNCPQCVTALRLLLFFPNRFWFLLRALCCEGWTTCRWNDDPGSFSRYFVPVRLNYCGGSSGWMEALTLCRLLLCSRLKARSLFSWVCIGLCDIN